MGIDRAGIIKTVYGDLAGNTQPMNNMIYYSTQAAYKPDFAYLNYSPTKALAHPEEALHGWAGDGRVLAAPGPARVCPAKFRWSWTATNATRTNTEAIVKSELKSIGIELIEYPRAANVHLRPDRYPGRRLRHRRVRRDHDRRPR